jgi:hypothetical protein
MTKTPADILADTGRALFGDRWRLPLADALGVDERQIRRWLSGASELATSYTVFAKAEKLLRDREREITNILRTLERWRSQDDPDHHQP